MTLDRLTAALSDRYTIERELGAGGMATVYLAEDLKHKRKVAIKVLKPELAAVLGADRFVQEITTTAALQHPHILPLFDSGESDGFLWYAMPFIDGETLRDKLNRETQLSVDEAVKLTSEVADALHYAHTQGVVHRDIKPENILLANGRPMVADFGIALALSAAAGGRMTETGMSLGTPHYMSPEQATADKEIGPRSDIYSLSSVCYEMLTGEPPHMGGSAQAIIMKIIAETAAPVTKVRKSVPANVAAAVGKALEKLPADRFESAKAFAEALGNPAFAHHAAGTAASVRAGGGGNRWMVAARTAGIAILAVAGGWVLRGSRVPEEPVASVHAFLSDTALQLMAPGSGVAISPDGKTVIVSRSPRMPDGALFVRAIDDPQFRRIDGTAGMVFPRISPDGQSVVFHSGSRDAPSVQQMPLGGGPVRTLADSAILAGWCDDGSLVVQRDGTIMRIAEAGAAPVAIMEIDSVQVNNPSVLPDCSGLLFNDADSADERRGLLLDLRTGAVSEFAPRAYLPRYVAPGHILYQSGRRSVRSLMAMPFDLDRHRVTGIPVQMVPLIWDWDISRTGTLVYSVPLLTNVGDSLAWVGTSGSVTLLPVNGPDFESPRISPDGRQFAFYNFDTRTLLLYDVSTGATSTIMESLSDPSWAWAPDGRAMYVASDRKIVRVSTSGTGAVDTLHEHHGNVRVFAVSPDQDRLVLGERVEERRWDITLLHLDDPTLTVKPYLRANWNEAQPALSPDGRWLAYVSDESGSDEVYARSFPVPGDPIRISDSGGTAPAWAPGGTKMFYDGVSDLMQAELTFGPAGPSVRSRTPLFAHEGFEVATRGLFTSFNSMRRWDVTPDGTRFLMVRSADETFLGGTELRVITNFPDAIRRRMATP